MSKVSKTSSIVWRETSSPSIVIASRNSALSTEPSPLSSHSRKRSSTLPACLASASRSCSAMGGAPSVSSRSRPASTLDTPPPGCRLVAFLGGDSGGEAATLALAAAAARRAFLRSASAFLRSASRAASASASCLESCALSSAISSSYLSRWLASSRSRLCSASAFCLMVLCCSSAFRWDASALAARWCETASASCDRNSTFSTVLSEIISPSSIDAILSIATCWSRSALRVRKSACSRRNCSRSDSSSARSTS
mmetsp:Transcript_18548/g.50313  ORF Transcript_18548/g.50313 Transcript_18548/m.50313 type:complete len:254 (-) Transcript_18548:81-842(-)